MNAAAQPKAVLSGDSNGASSTYVAGQLNLESASSASLISQAMSLSGVGTVSERNLFRPRSAQPLQLSPKVPVRQKRPKLNSLPGCEALPDERKLRLLRQTHMSRNFAALNIQKVFRGKQARAELDARTSYAVGKERGSGAKRNDLSGGKILPKGHVGRMASVGEAPSRHVAPLARARARAR